MHLLMVVIHNDEPLDELITGWLDLGITGTTVFETTDALQFISEHVPIFAGFRALSGGGKMPHNKTLLTVVESEGLLNQAILFLKALLQKAGNKQQGVYFAAPLSHYGMLGTEEDAE